MGFRIMTGVIAHKARGCETVEIRVRGTVQGVGFRPNVWRIARELNLCGTVCNDNAGVLIKVSATSKEIAKFVKQLRKDVPPLAHIEQIEINPVDPLPDVEEFQILESLAGSTRTRVSADAATCPACKEEALDPFGRRYRYPFTNCTHCGPRFSIIETVPYDRASTTMAKFLMCPDCAKEYVDPQDRRFHAQPIACHACGPKAWLERLDGAATSFDQHSMLDDVDAISGLLQKGEIVAIRALGGFHLACDAQNEEAVMRLRERKHRYAKPFALMARDLDVIRQYCSVSEREQELLESPESPIVLLQASGDKNLPDVVAQGMNTLGFMLPTMPMHDLILRRIKRPIVMTSGNLSDEPQVTSIEDARSRLKDIADYVLFHDRDIANRIDDSVVRVMGGKPRILRRARGYAPGALPLPIGFEKAPDLLAYGGELKSTFCLLKDGAAILSQHQGDLEHPATYDDYLKNLALYKKLYDHEPKLLVADKHPEYLSTKLAQSDATSGHLPLTAVQHHHAHIASCMAENGIELDTEPVLGVALDGLGFGDDGTIWGGEFLLADYRGYDRLATFKPIAMLGGAKAIRQPWRNTYAHLMSEIGWPQFAMNFSQLEIFTYLDAKPRETLDQMLIKGVNSPLASSCGRLFDAVAAAIGVCRGEAQYEGQGAIELEALVDEKQLREEDDALGYPFAIPKLNGDGLPYIEPIAMWQALLGDLHMGAARSVMATRFHKGLAKIIAIMVKRLVDAQDRSGVDIDTVALSGGCFQNKVLLEQVIERLEVHKLKVITQARVPANDGGLALGQAAIAAARYISNQNGSGGN